MGRIDFAAMAPEAFINLRQYPIARLDEESEMPLVRRPRITLQITGAVSLPGFSCRTR